MKFYKSIFLLVATVYSTNSFSCTSSGTAGKYCHNLQNSTCPAGCYCPGKGGYTAYTAGKVESWCKNRTGLNSGGLNSDGTVLASCVYLCPSGFTSDAGKSSASECYLSGCSSKTTYKTGIKPKVGEYLPKCAHTPVKCPSGSRCPGGGSYTSSTSDQGIAENCAPGTQPNSNHTACEKKTVTCGSNEIYNSDKTACTKCEVGTHPNSSKTECVAAAAQTVQPGYYLPKGANQKPKQCTQSTFYCPGGEFTESDTDQGKLKCPSGSTANSRKTACTLKISKENLKFGPDKNMPEDYQCWMYVGDAAKYKSCVLSKLYYK